MVRGLTRAYSTVRVDPDKFLLQLRAAYRMPISGYHGVYSLEIGEIDVVADSVIRSGMKVAAVEGAGLGLGGLITIVPDLGILSAITMRTIEKLSLVYGFEFKTDDDIAELWVAAASAAGVDISRELLEKEVINKFVPKVIQRIAAKASAEVVEKWAGRLDSSGEFGDWGGTELLVCAGVGGACQIAFPAEAFVIAATGAGGGVGGRGADESTWNWSLVARECRCPDLARVHRSCASLRMTI